LRRGKYTAVDVAERLDLPAETAGALLVTAAGRNSVLIENHLGITHYGPELLCLKTRDGSFSVYGGDLRIAALGRGKLLLRGGISSMEWE